MPIPQHIVRKLQETLGADAADHLVSRLEGMEANRGDIGELRHEMQLGFARIEARFEQVEARFKQVDARFDQILAQTNARFEQVDARFEQMLTRMNDKLEQTNAQWDGRFATGQAKMEALLEKGLREQTRFFFLAWSVLLAAIVGLYGR